MPDSDRVGVHIPADYHTADDALQGRIIAVTGATAGIGRSAALAYARHGATVVLIGRSEDRLAAVYDAIEAAGGPQPAAITFDFTCDDEERYAALADAIAAEFPRLDGLLLNASVLGERRPLAQAGWAAWQEVMQVNVNSQFLTLRALLPLLEEAPAPSVVFTSSGVGRIGKAYWGAYAASKFATEAMMQMLAAESENTSALRSNAINPGATNTAMRRAAYPGERPDDNPDPEAIMPTYLYLMDDASAACTGLSFDAQ
jgi:NAD(P)-dependent dehydrogenase (short-subunit alcohol dehydrogenase family)